MPILGIGLGAITSLLTSHRPCYSAGRCSLKSLPEIGDQKSGSRAEPTPTPTCALAEASSCSSSSTRACNRSTVACARPCSVTETLANFLCHPRQGSGRIDVATELGDDGVDAAFVVHPLGGERYNLSCFRWHFAKSPPSADYQTTRAVPIRVHTPACPDRSPNAPGTVR